MKRKALSLLLALGIVVSCTGCKSNSTTEEKNFGRFIVLEEQGEYREEDYHLHTQYLVYDKDTYIIYVYDVTKNGGVSISPFYCMNTDNEPVIAVYYDGMEE